MRPVRLFPVVLLAACGSDPATTTSDPATTGGTTGLSDPPVPTTGPPPTTGTTGVEGSGGLTDGGTTTAASTTSDATTTSTSSTTTTTDTTSPIDPDTTTSTSTTTTTAGTTTDASSTGDTGDTTTGDGPCACPDLEVGLDDGIFVLSDTAEMWKYYPDTNKFTLLGELGCDLPPPTFSMAVDRLGFAWVEYNAGDLRKVDVNDVTICTDPGYPENQQAVANFGMAFVSNSAADKCDRIFGNEYNGFPNSDFFSIDPDTLQMTKHGTTPYGVAELTGTGDGRAFMFTVTNPPMLVEVDKTNGATLSSLPLDGVQIGSGLAFAFFAGDFYFFTDAQLDNTSEVTHLDYDDSDMNGQKDLTKIFNNAPLRILGAGVSTCVPTLPQ